MKVTIQGVSFDLTAPYEAGHTIDTVEATALNQVRAENIANNMRREVKNALGDQKELTDEQHKQLQESITDYDNRYDFKTARSYGSSDPLTVKARYLAKNAIKLKLASTGISLKEYKANLGGYDVNDEFIDKQARDKGNALYNAKVNELASHKQIIAQAKKELEGAKEINFDLN